MFPAISSDRSNEDISNLQLKGSTAPTPGLVISPSPRPSSVACDPGHPGAAKPRAIIPAKPILKHRKPEPGPASSEECQPGPQRYYGDGNWYTNPMDSSYFPTNSSYHQVSVLFLSCLQLQFSFCPLSVDADINCISFNKKFRILLQPSPVPCQVATRPCRPGTVTAPPLPASSPTTRSTSSPAWPRTRSRPPQGFLAPRSPKGAPGTATWVTWAPCPAPSPRSSPGQQPRRSIRCQAAPATPGE